MSKDSPDKSAPVVWTPPPLKSVAQAHRERRQRQVRAAIAGAAFILGSVIYQLFREWRQGRLNIPW